MVIYSTKQIVTSVYNKGCKPRKCLIYTLHRGEDGIRTRGTGYPVRQFSKLVVSATHPPLRALLTDCGGISLHPGYKAKLFLDKSKKMKLKYETRTNLFVVVNSLNNICKDVGNRKNCKFRQIFVLLQRNGVRNDHLLQCTLVDAVVCRA